MKKLYLPALISALAIAGCGGDDDDNSFLLNVELRSEIVAAGLTGDPSIGRVLPSINDPKTQLGMKLFFSKALGGDTDSACVSCHHPVLGGGDDLSLPIGVEADVPDLLGPGRTHSSSGNNFDGGPTVPRNAPTTFNMGLWDEVLFHDGRVESLIKMTGANGSGPIRTPDTDFGVVDPNAGSNLTAAQARFPVTSKEEMRGFTFEAGNTNDDVRTHLEARLQGNTIPPELATNNWLAEFQIGLGNPQGTAEELITYANIADALAEYQRSQVFVDTPWKSYVQGDDNAISNQAKRGALLFLRSRDEGGADCASCHSGDFFTDEQFYVLAMPQVGRGKENDNGFNEADDFGRFRETENEDDRYAFRTPTLLNVDDTGPWSHAGAYTTLEGVVRHHLNPQQAIINYDFNQLEASVQTMYTLTNTQLAMDKLTQNRNNGLPSIQDINLSDAQVQQLLAFLRTLTDPCVKDRDCIGAWIPGANDSDPDGLRVNAIDRNGNPL